MKKHLLTNSKNGGGITKLNSNAFTLIELLAIIVILAIIAVITVPIILNIIENSRKGAATDSAYGYKDAVNKYYLGKLSENQNYNDLDGEYTIDSNGYLVENGTVKHQIQVSGQKPSGGTMTIENKIITTACVQMGDYKVSITNGTVGQTEKGECSSSLLVTQYGYKSYDTENYEETEIIKGTSGYTATGKNAYLKYALTNGEVAEGTVPETCIYSESYPQKELCLKKDDDYDTSISKIYAYFGYNSNTWINDENDTNKWYNNEEKTIQCVIGSESMSCSGYGVGVNPKYSNAKISFVDDFTCYLYDNGTAYCD